MSAPEVVTLDCQRCGACCSPGAAMSTFVVLTKRDEKRLPRWLQRMLVRAGSWCGGTVFMPTRRGLLGHTVCKALDGALGRHVECSIYANRPTACRKFARGSSGCLAAREAMLGT